MGRKLYVGNLPFSADSKQVEDLFTGVGKVNSAVIIMDRETGRSKGFGFVEMDNEVLAKDAIAELNGSDWQGRQIRVSEANERPRRQPESSVHG